MVLTNTGRQQLLEALKSQVTHFAMGTGQNTDNEFASSLGQEVFRKDVTDKTVDIETNSIDFECFIGSSEGNGNNFSELGLLDSPSGGNLFVISNFPAENKSALLEWLIDIVIEIK
jgi:hypothetical protein